MRLNIAVVSGGDSGEYDISIQSGQVVKKHLDPNQYKVYPIIIKGQDFDKMLNLASDVKYYLEQLSSIERINIKIPNKQDYPAISTILKLSKIKIHVTSLWNHQKQS